MRPGRASASRWSRIRELSALTPEDQARVLAEFATHGTERLKPVFEALGKTIPYEELHIMRMVDTLPEDHHFDSTVRRSMSLTVWRILSSK